MTRMAASPLSPREPDAPPASMTLRRVAALIACWLVIAWLAAPPLGLYYEGRASLYLVPPLLVAYGYCLSHRRRATALLALVSTVLVALAIGLAALIPKATPAFAS